MLKKIIFALFVLLPVACAPGARNAQREQYAYLPHTVSYEGETLVLIARWYTGRSDNWTLIADANPEIDPRRIQLGQLVKIPQRLLITEEPLPQRYVAKAYQNAPKPVPTANAGMAGDAGLAPLHQQGSNSLGSAEPQDKSTDSSAVAPPEKSLPEAAAPSADVESGAAHDKSRDELLNELLKE
ncbi:MAG: LysM peptidoglycan-binding domain-containing protein [Oligoflexia bacterium]|nr:LysM peptidoglycan-binding domain-containing protein [Oligoflexia bacterium]